VLLKSLSLFQMMTKEYILQKLKSSKAVLSRFGIRSVGLFGSYVRNENTHYSDIDLLIDFDPQKESFDNFMKVCNFFEELFGNQKVDIVTKNGLSPHIGPKILSEVVYV